MEISGVSIMPVRPLALFRAQVLGTLRELVGVLPLGCAVMFCLRLRSLRNTAIIDRIVGSTTRLRAGRFNLEEIFDPPNKIRQPFRLLVSPILRPARRFRAPRRFCPPRRFSASDWVSGGICLVPLSLFRLQGEE